jgi:hypothetical protein
METDMNSEHTSTFDWGQLGFVPEVLSAFSFLSTDYGFAPIRVETTFVRYESASLFVNVYHGRRSFELGVEIGLLQKSPGTQEDWFSIGDIMDLTGVREKHRYTFFQASTRERVTMLIPRLAEYVKEYAKPIFEGDLQIFERLEDLRGKKSDAYVKDMDLRQIRPKAEEAWHKKDYAKLVELYNSMKDDLTVVESKKLEYAQKRLHSA